MMPHDSKQEGQRRTWTEFTQETSIHGIRYVTTKQFSKSRRVVWLVLVLGCLNLSFLISINLLRDFIDKTVGTRMKISPRHQLKFPVVTICNRNPVHVGNAIKKLKELNVSVEAAKEILTPPNGAHSLYNTKVNWSEPKFHPLASMTPKDVERLYQELGHQINGTFLYCTSGGVTKKCADIVKHVKTTAGFCFQLNSVQEITSHAPGLGNGISLMLNADVENYSPGYSTYSEGFYITFSEEHEAPLMESLSVGAGPGLQTQIMLMKSEISRVPPPADGGKANCHDTLNKPNPLLYYKNYSYSNCITECKTSYVLNRCGCRDPLQPALDGAESCNLPAMLNCSQPANLAFVSDEEGLKSCRCPHPCIESDYTAQVSSYRFPNFKYFHHIGLAKNYSQLQQLRDNLLWVDIYFGKLSVTKVQEYITVGAYDVLEFQLNRSIAEFSPHRFMV